MTQKERRLREQEKSNTYIAEDITISEIDLSGAIGKRSFSIDQFRTDHPARYQKILRKIHQDYEQTFKELEQEFDSNKYRKAIEDKVYHTCLQWSKNNTSKT